MIFQSSCRKQVMWYSSTQDLNMILIFFCSFFFFSFFITSVMQHITINWTVVWCLLTRGFTSDPEVWFKQKYTKIPKHSHTRMHTELLLVLSLQSNRKVLDGLGTSAHSNKHTNRWAATHNRRAALLSKHKSLLETCRIKKEHNKLPAYIHQQPLFNFAFTLFFRCLPSVRGGLHLD